MLISCCPQNKQGYLNYRLCAIVTCKEALLLRFERHASGNQKNALRWTELSHQNIEFLIVSVSGKGISIKIKLAMINYWYKGGNCSSSTAAFNHIPMSGLIFTT